MERTHKNNFFEIKNLNENTAEIRIYGTITKWAWEEYGEISSANFAKELQKLKDVSHINLRVNSPGGDVFEASAIYNLLKDYAKVNNVEITGYIDGLAASAASFLVLCATKVIMGTGALYMIHNPLTSAYGNAEKLKKQIELLDTVKEAILDIYCTKSKLSREEISELMNTTTYFTADQAIEKGFATEKIIFDIKNSEFSNLENFKIRPKQIINSGDTEKKGGESMGAKNMQELEAQNKELVEDIRKEAIAQERKRINDLDVLNEQTQGKCKEIIDAAKESGKSKADIVEDVLAKFIENKGTEEKKVPEAKNPADILNTRREESKQIEIDNRIPRQIDDTKNLIADIVNIANQE